jgi:cysteinyl-tRNA synthetase
MAMKYLGDTVDIHGGGVDNIFPHNEDEIAQSECATCKPFVRYWMHTGSLRVNGVKMSKSLGNFTTVGDALAEYGPTLLRFFVVSSHYRSPLDYSKEAMADAGRALERLQIAVQNADRFVSLLVGGNGALGGANPPRRNDGACGGTRCDWEDPDAVLRRHRDAFLAGMDDDFNTPVAIAALFELAKEMNAISAVPGAVPTPATRDAVARMRGLMVELSGILGLDLTPTGREAEGDLAPGLISLLLELRQHLREKRDFAGADRVRDGLRALEIVVEDRPEGPTWRRA